MGGSSKTHMPEGWAIIPDKHNGYTYKGVRVKRINRQRGMVELKAKKDTGQGEFGAIALGVFQAMEKLTPKIEDEYDL